MIRIRRDTRSIHRSQLPILSARAEEQRGDLGAQPPYSFFKDFGGFETPYCSDFLKDVCSFVHQLVLSSYCFLLEHALRSLFHFLLILFGT